MYWDMVCSKNILYKYETNFSKGSVKPSVVTDVDSSSILSLNHEIPPAQSDCQVTFSPS